MVVSRFGIVALSIGVLFSVNLKAIFCFDNIMTLVTLKVWME